MQHVNIKVRILSVFQADLFIFFICIYFSSLLLVLSAEWKCQTVFNVCQMHLAFAPVRIFTVPRENAFLPITAFLYGISCVDLAMAAIFGVRLSLWVSMQAGILMSLINYALSTYRVHQLTWTENPPHKHNCFVWLHFAHLILGVNMVTKAFC